MLRPISLRVRPVLSISELQGESLAFDVFYVALFALRRLRRLSWLFHLPQQGDLIGSTCISFAAIGAHVDIGDTTTKRSNLDGRLVLPQFKMVP